MIAAPEKVSNEILDGDGAAEPSTPYEHRIESRERERLVGQLRDYRRQIAEKGVEPRGRSFLIAGHRGAGKTRLVADAIELVNGDTEIGGADADVRPARFLRVDIHGPSLLRAPERPSRSADDGDPTVRSALKLIVLALYRALVRETCRCYWDRAERWLPAVDLETGASAASTLVLRKRRELLERAAQLELELDEYPSPRALRTFWDAGEYLERGLFFEERGRPGQGFRELVSICTACEAYRRVSGTYETAKEIAKRKAARTRSSGFSLDTTGKDLVSAATSVFVGAGSAIGLIATSATGVTGGVATGLAAAIGSSLTFKLSSTSTNDASVSREYTFIPDMSVSTLDRVLPTLIERISDTGLVPVFVVDELDKVENLRGRMKHIVSHLKKFVSEQAFFCFLTDRQYYEELEDLSVRGTYPIEHTYFTDKLFVVFELENLHGYVEGCLTTWRGGGATGSDLELDRRLLPYVLLQRSELHAIDIERELRQLIRTPASNGSAPGNDRAGEAREPVGLEGRGAVRTLPNQCDFLLHLAARVLIDGPTIRPFLERQAPYRRLVYDALYYPIRERKRGLATLDLTSETGREAFHTYMRSRLRSLALEDIEADDAQRAAAAGIAQRGAPASAPTTSPPSPSRAHAVESLVAVVGQPDRETRDPGPRADLQQNVGRTLFDHVRDYARLVADPFELLLAIEEWERETGIELSKGMIENLPLANRRGPLLSGTFQAPLVYRWGLDQLGRPFETDQPFRRPDAHLLDLWFRLIARVLVHRAEVRAAARVDPRIATAVEAMTWRVHALWEERTSPDKHGGLAPLRIADDLGRTALSSAFPHLGLPPEVFDGPMVRSQREELTRLLISPERLWDWVDHLGWSVTFRPVQEELEALFKRLPDFARQTDEDDVLEWCVRFSGLPVDVERVAALVPEERDLAPLHDFVSQVGEGIVDVTGGSVTLTELSSRFGILRADLSWQRMKDGLERVHDFLTTRTGHPKLGEDIEYLREYAGLIERSGDLIPLALLAGATVGGPGEGINRGLLAIARGYDLAGRSKLSPRQTLEALLAEATGQTPAFTAPTVEGELTPWFDDLRTRIEALEVEGSAGLPDTDRLRAAQDEAWAAWKHRLEEEAALPDPTLAELRCEAAHVSPFGMIRLPFDDLTVAQWSALIHHASRTDRSDPQMYVPSWVAPLAADRLWVTGTRVDLEVSNSAVVVPHEGSSRLAEWLPDVSAPVFIVWRSLFDRSDVDLEAISRICQGIGHFVFEDAEPGAPLMERLGVDPDSVEVWRIQPERGPQPEVDGNPIELPSSPEALFDAMALSGIEMATGRLVGAAFSPLATSLRTILGEPDTELAIGHARGKAASSREALFWTRARRVTRVTDPLADRWTVWGARSETEPLARVVVVDVDDGLRVRIEPGTADTPGVLRIIRALLRLNGPWREYLFGVHVDDGAVVFEQHRAKRWGFAMPFARRRRIVLRPVPGGSAEADIHLVRGDRSTTLTVPIDTIESE